MVQAFTSIFLHFSFCGVGEAMKTGRGGIVPIVLLFFSVTANLLVHCDARKPHKGSIIKSTKKMQINIMEDDGDASPLTELDSSSSTNTLPYVSSPFTLPPYDSLPPVPLPDNSPPYCIYPPPIGPPPPPPTTMQSQPPGPIVSVPSPPELPPTPNPPQSFPSPPFTIPSPPGTVPSPPYTYEPSPPEYIPSPPTGITPSPPTGFAPSPPVFQPPVVFPSPAVPPPSPPTVGALWCVAKPSVPLPIIQEAMDYACGSGADCSFIQPDQACFEPNTLLAHASYAFNSYWQRTKVAGGTCDFGGVAILVTVDPSYRGCHFVYS